MEEKVDIVALEELLIDFTEAGHSQDGRFWLTVDKPICSS